MGLTAPERKGTKVSGISDVSKLDCILQDVENELQMVGFALLQTLQTVRTVKGEDSSTNEFALDEDGVSVIYGTESAIRNMCERIHKTLQEF